MIKEIINSIYRISSNSLAEIEKIVKYENYDKGISFIEKNKLNNKEYFLLEGVCKSYLINPEGNEITLSFFDENSVLSPYTTRTSNNRSLICFKSLTDIKLASIDANIFAELMVNNLEIRNFGNQVLRNELACKVDKEIGLASLTAKERLIKLREQFPLLENLVPHTDIATYLGITNISLSRLRKGLIK
ncbi:MAG TPA: Crp/Fnr family transcriptional regulator [Cytophagales bacterium]|jgi:CRP-like cAMP-binding protein|nr:Crp/Fnr family transcriptional regulator [Cytophagales bacterium]